MIRHPIDAGWFISYQPAHALLSGCLAAHWAGTDDFPRPTPWPDLVVAVSQHDAGWIEWEQAPKISDEGIPLNFTELDIADHLRIWRRGVATGLHQSRFVGLMLSRHATRLYDHRSDESQIIANFLAEQHRLQNQLVAEFDISPDAVDEAYSLVRLMDWFSLALCMERYHDGVVELGAGPGGVELTMEPLGEHRLMVRPWPFDVSAITASVEARRLTQRSFADSDALQAALRDADIVERRWQLEAGA